MPDDGGDGGVQVRVRVERWLDEAVVGLNLCPFAAPVVRAGQVRIAPSSAADFDPAIEAFLDELSRLFDAAPDDVATTLVVFPHALGDFDDFLDAIAVVEALLEDSGADLAVQLAHFHPDYRFEGADDDALENYTNRAPYPILQLLRVADVADAVSRHPDPEGIPTRNIARLEAMGREAVEAMWALWRTGER